MTGIETLLAVGLTVSIPSLFIYLSGAYIEDDALFFMRKRQFKQKIVASGYPHTLALIQSLMAPSEKDWVHVGDFMYYKRYPDTKIVFDNSYGLIVRIFEGKSNKKVFELFYYEKSQKAELLYDVMNIKELSEEEQFKIQQVVLHLNDVLTKKQQNEQAFLETQEQKNSDDLLRKKELKIVQLLAIIKSNPSLQDVVKKDGFILRLTPYEFGKYLEISLDGTVYFQAIQINGQSDMKIAIQNRENKEARIFFEYAEHLHQYAKTVFGQNGQTTDGAFSGEHKKTLDLIHERLAQLAQEEAWLSTESWHKVSETFPHDLQALKESYQVVQDKEKAHHHVKDALHSIHQKLQIFVEEAENNKQKEVEKRKFIIEKR